MTTSAMRATGLVRARTQFAIVLAPLFRNASIGRLEASLLPFNVAEFGSWVAILAYAYRAGGVAASGMTGFLLLGSAALAAPLASPLCVRLFGRRAIVGSYAMQSVGYAATGVVMVIQAPLALVIIPAVAASMALASTRPLIAAALPATAETPQELTSAALFAGWIEGFGFVAGPAVAGAILLLAPPGAVYLVMAACLLVSALLVSSVEQEESVEARVVSSALSSLSTGLRVAASDGDSRAVLTFMSAHYLILGGIDIILVALAFRLLHAGQAGLGLLTSAFGLGCVFGASVGLLFLSGRRLTQGLVAGAIAWGIGLSCLALVPGRGVVVLLIVFAGAGRPLITVSGRLLYQRIALPESLTALFALLEGLSMAGIALGVACMPAVLVLLGNRLAFVAVGALLPVLLLLLFRRFSALEDRGVLPEERVALLRSVPMFQPLPLIMIDRLARSLEPVEAAAGDVIVRQGEPGRTFYLVAAGRLVVDVEGLSVRTLGDGDYFGEIALLRDGRRTATVTAQGPTYLYALDRTPFLTAVTGHPESSKKASAIVTTRLAADLARPPHVNS